MTEKIIIAGAGGQGIMLLGKIIAHAAMLENKHTTWIPAYGAEVRGGAAYCTVIISNEPIASPMAQTADTIIAFNEPSLEKFKNRVNNGGLLILNKSLINTQVKKDGLKIISLPFTDLALRLGNIKVANVVALGGYLKAKGILKVQSVEKAMQEMAPPGRQDLLEINQKALREGMKYG